MSTKTIEKELQKVSGEAKWNGIYTPICNAYTSKGFTRIRHYGILSSTCKLNAIAQIRAQLPAVYLPEKTASAAAYDPSNMFLLQNPNDGCY
ncbi:MAG: hypothetical protein IPO63_15780 [Bacteroidetes bacterium]|nr:hypothetical protein [Bacteroidota bacterium]